VVEGALLRRFIAAVGRFTPEREPTPAGGKPLGPSIADAEIWYPEGIRPTQAVAARRSRAGAGRASGRRSSPSPSRARAATAPGTA